MHFEHGALLVDDEGVAIEFLVRARRFDLIEDSPTLTNDGRPKRWVVVGPPGAQTNRPFAVPAVPTRWHRFAGSSPAESACLSASMTAMSHANE
jgi:hypothetical protein